VNKLLLLSYFQFLHLPRLHIKLSTVYQTPKKANITSYQ